MVTITRTFDTQFDKDYAVVAPATTTPIREVVHFRNEIFDADERVSCYLDTANAVVDIGSFNIGKIPNLDTADSPIEEALLLGKAESESQKIGIRVLTRKNNTGTWLEIAEFILLNYGRKDYLDMRTKIGYPTRIMEANDAIAVQLIDYGDGLLWDIDLITISFACSIEIEKKNNLDALTARLAALELALEGRLINLPANTLLGRNTGTGTVERIDRATFVQADSTIGIKRLVGITASTQGAFIGIAHGLNANKILGIIANVAYEINEGLGPNYDDPLGPGYAYNCWYDVENINILNSANSSQFVLGKPVSVLVFYAA